MNRKDAVLVKCFHVFCLECLRTRYETRQRKCPKCNAGFGANDFHRLYLSWSEHCIVIVYLYGSWNQFTENNILLQLFCVAKIDLVIEGYFLRLPTFRDTSESDLPTVTSCWTLCEVMDSVKKTSDITSSMVQTKSRLIMTWLHGYTLLTILI